MPRIRAATGRIVPLFPRYLFILINRPWGCVPNTKGVADIVRCGDQLGQISTQVMSDLQAISHDEPDELIPLPVTFGIGQELVAKSTEHMTAGSILIYQGMKDQERCEVLWSIFGRTTRAHIPVKELRAYN